MGELDDLLTEEQEARDSLNTMYVTWAKVGSMSILGRQTKNFGRELRSEASDAVSDLQSTIQSVNFNLQTSEGSSTRTRLMEERAADNDFKIMSDDVAKDNDDVGDDLLNLKTQMNYEIRQTQNLAKKNKDSFKTIQKVIAKAFPKAHKVMNKGIGKDSVKTYAKLDKEIEKMIRKKEKALIKKRNKKL